MVDGILKAYSFIIKDGEEQGQNQSHSFSARLKIGYVMGVNNRLPRVSVIIPVYNCECYIGQAVESVLNQTYKNYEIFVIDDGSTDNTRQALEPYNTKIQYVYQKNQGVAASRNLGINMARGELVAFLDHDDLFLSDKLAAQVSCFETGEQVGIVHSGWCRIDRSGNRLANVQPWHKAPNLDLDGWLRWKPILLGAMMFRRQWLEQVGGLDPQFQQACDLDLILRLTLMGCESIWMHQITLFYREHENNHSRNTPVQVGESWDVLERLFLQANLPDPICQFENQYRYHTLVWGAWRLYSTGYRPEMAECLEKSLTYSPYSLTKTISDWIENFIKYSREYGIKLNVGELCSSIEWQQLVSLIF